MKQHFLYVWLNIPRDQLALYPTVPAIGGFQEFCFLTRILDEKDTVIKGFFLVEALREFLEDGKLPRFELSVCGGGIFMEGGKGVSRPFIPRGI